MGWSAITDVGVSVCTLGLYPLLIEWGALPLATVAQRVKNGGAKYDVWSVTYTAEERVESIRTEVKQSLLWPKGWHDDAARE